MWKTYIQYSLKSDFSEIELRTYAPNTASQLSKSGLKVQQNLVESRNLKFLSRTWAIKQIIWGLKSKKCFRIPYNVKELKQIEIVENCWFY